MRVASRDISRAAGAGVFALLLMSTAQRVTPTVASGILREHLRLTSSEFGVLAGASALAFGLAQFPGGYLSDVHGPVRVIKLAAIASAFGTLVFLTAATYPIALAGRVVFGVADSIVFVGLMRFAVGSTSGGGAYHIGKVQATVGASFASAAVLALGLNATSFPILFGGLAVVQVALALAIKSPPRGGGRATALPAMAEVMEVARTRQFWAALLANTGLFAPFFAWTSGWAVPYLVAVVGMSTDQARLVVVAGSLASVAGALALGRLSDVLRRRRHLMLVGSAVMTGAWALLIVLGTPGAVPTVALAMVVGFTFPACNSSLVLAKESFRADRAGMVMGLSNMASSLLAALLGAAAGLALDAGWQGALDHGLRVYPRHAYIAVPAVFMVGSALAVLGALLAKETHGRQVPAPIAA